MYMCNADRTHQYNNWAIPSLAGAITRRALEPFVLLNLEPSNGHANVFTSMPGVQQAMLSETDYRSMTCCMPMSTLDSVKVMVQSNTVPWMNASGNQPHYKLWTVQHNAAADLLVGKSSFVLGQPAVTQQSKDNGVGLASSGQFLHLGSHHLYDPLTFAMNERRSNHSRLTTRSTHGL